jgi:hypothetical protein
MFITVKLNYFSALFTCIYLSFNMCIYSNDSEPDTSSFIWLPGAARIIPRTESASRDRAVLEYAYGPVAHSSIGGEWAWFRVNRPTRTFRFGLYAMIALENHDWATLFPPVETWRGMTGFNWAWLLDNIAAKWFGKDGAFELGLVLGHESDHGTVDDPWEPDFIPGGGGGQFLTPDIAIRIPVTDKFWFTTRIQSRTYLAGTLIIAPGADAILRWHVREWFNVLVALFGEGLFPREKDARNGFFVRCMYGANFPGKIGEFTFFVSTDGGNGKGFLINHLDFRFSFGVRYAPFTK